PSDDQRYLVLDLDFDTRERATSFLHFPPDPGMDLARQRPGARRRSEDHHPRGCSTTAPCGTVKATPTHSERPIPYTSGAVSARPARIAACDCVEEVRSACSGAPGAGIGSVRIMLGPGGQLPQARAPRSGLVREAVAGRPCEGTGECERCSSGR